MKHVAGTSEIKLYICMQYETVWTINSTSWSAQLSISLSGS